MEPARLNESSYRRQPVFVALAASAGIVIGTLGPWISTVIFSPTGLDDGNWGIAALTLGALSFAAMAIVLFWQRSPLDPKWVAPLAWGTVIAGVACASVAVPTVIRIMTGPKASMFGIPIGPGVGWGLYLLAVSALVLCVAGSAVAWQSAKLVDASTGSPPTRWSQRWRWAAGIAAVLVAAAGIGYTATHWNSDDTGYPSPTELPSLPPLPTDLAPPH